jgi:hypothetical protein
VEPAATTPLPTPAPFWTCSVCARTPPGVDGGTSGKPANASAATQGRVRPHMGVPPCVRLCRPVLQVLRARVRDGRGGREERRRGWVVAAEERGDGEEAGDPGRSNVHHERYPGYNLLEDRMMVCTHTVIVVFRSEKHKSEMLARAFD